MVGTAGRDIFNHREMFGGKATPTTAPSQLPVHSNSALTVEECEVRQVMRKVNPRKAAGPDGVLGRVLKDCAYQLAGIFTKIFNQSLSQATVPPCLKSSTIVPLPKKNNINTLNDYRPVALTPIIMKTKELVIDFRKNKMDIQPLTISGTCVERVPVFRFLGMEQEDKVTWSTNTKELLKKAQQRLFFLRILKKNCLPLVLLQAFYHCSIESVLSYSLCVWYGSSTSSDKKALQRVVRAAERTIGCPLPTMEQIYTSRLRKKVSRSLITSCVFSVTCVSVFVGSSSHLASCSLSSVCPVSFPILCVPVATGVEPRLPLGRAARLLDLVN
ncbi:hypothetical protein CCH79_00018881 [Gambusia affinis]|uniref:Alkylated DNA repair protein AlkB homologue 8 N-terminal domain-containing protein n=1 Tax=Gambusia affinis TaxID=33528 RepID=A0A315VFL2_GAMAF|nr:hypothetical protein CCH79_00018881 [Gambusia affinis]